MLLHRLTKLVGGCLEDIIVLGSSWPIVRSNDFDKRFYLLHNCALEVVGLKCYLFEIVTPSSSYASSFSYCISTSSLTSCISSISYFISTSSLTFSNPTSAPLPTLYPPPHLP